MNGLRFIRYQPVIATNEWIQLKNICAPSHDTVLTLKPQPVIATNGWIQWYTIYLPPTHDITPQTPTMVSQLTGLAHFAPSQWGGSACFILPKKNTLKKDTSSKIWYIK